MVRDYKGKTVHAGARWAQDGRLQAALYALAARELLGLEPAGALYQPIGKGDRRPRGLRAAPGRRAATSTATSSSPRRSTPRCGEAREAALGAARAMRAGEIAPVPVALLAERLRLPGDLPRRRRSAGASA